MRKFWLKLAFPATLSLQSLIGAGIPAPVVKCTVDGAPVDCNPGDQNLVTVSGFAGLGGNVIELFTSATAVAGYYNNSTSEASVSLNFMATTEGPVRPGLVMYRTSANSGGSTGAGGTSSSIFAGPIGCSSVHLESCSSSNVVDFQLGMPFLVGFSANAVANLDPENPSWAVGWGSVADLLISFHEVGTSGETLPVDVLLLPEPNAFCLALVGGVGILLRLRHRKC